MRQPLFYFFSLTFVISWSLFIAAAIISRNTSSPDSPFSPVGYIIYLIGVFAPALVAIFLSWREKGKAGVLALLSKIIKAPSDWRWYVFAVGYFVIIKLLAAIIYRVITSHWPLVGHESFFIIVIAVIFSTPTQAGEEIGWRGFALPRLSDRFGLAAASIILGIIWAAWHLPFFFFQNADKFGQSFPVYLLSVTALSVAMAWLYWRTNSSLLITMLMHSAVNNTTGIVPSVLTGAKNQFSLNASLIAWITTAILIVFAVYFLKQMRNARINPG
jgi:membrane protease YdiL (CAAX protease family)